MSETQGKLFDVEYRSTLFAFPVKEMAKRGWINVRSLTDLPRIKAELMRFFGCETIEELEGMATGDEETVNRVWNRQTRARR